MHAASVIVEVQVITRSAAGSWSWRALHGQRERGVSHLELAGLQEGDRLVAEVFASSVGWQITRLVRIPPHVREVRTTPDRGTEADRVSELSGDQRSSIAAGDILLYRFRFSHDDGSGRQSKERPCLVMAVAGDELRVRAIHGSNTFVRRQGLGRRVIDWQRSGLRKPSVVIAEDRFIPRRGLGRAVGRLSEQDRRRLLDSE